MKLVVKIALGVVLTAAVLLAGYALLIGDRADKDKQASDKAKRQTKQAAKGDGSSPKGDAGDGKTVDVGRKSGDFAIAEASGRVGDPAALKLRVSSAPQQEVTVSYTLVCTHGARAKAKGGQFKAMTLVTRQLPTPSGSDSCLVSANAQLSKGGRVKVTILG